WIKGSAILGCVGCLVGHLFMFLVGGKTPDQSVHLNLTTTLFFPQRAIGGAGDGTCGSGDAQRGAAGQQQLVGL
ncbi:hypothetical protein L6P16_11775, partial [Klebsiella pneumoniae]|nr:hypothetical protein [Klebsiella pneumoniae]MCL3238519.1 hypothetical protein [Klebsiella pneumoniae]MCL3244130.1 hypothetical protein [Klebsiella pneumoniae]MCL3249746.1 hypothetical protein [Klebsiella pneumoniae]